MAIIKKVLKAYSGVSDDTKKIIIPKKSSIKAGDYVLIQKIIYQTSNNQFKGINYGERITRRVWKGVKGVSIPKNCSIKIGDDVAITKISDGSVYFKKLNLKPSKKSPYYKKKNLKI